MNLNEWIAADKPLNSYINCDNMELMKLIPDNYIDLAVVDPPYGIGINGQVGGGKLAKVSIYKKKNWDNKIPNKEYFQQLFRISKKQIIWGGNYMIENLYNTPCFIIWDKNNTGNFADAELAWTSFKSSTRIFKFTWNGMLQENMKNKEKRIHETQKPVDLYRWILQNYAKPNDIIFDSHVGSASSLIACHEEGFKYIACELDEDYYRDSCKRLETHLSQLKLF